MEFSQAARVVKTDTSTVVHDGFGLIIQLVEALKDVLLLFLGDALARIGNRDFHLIASHIELYIDMSPLRRKLQGVREQIRYYLLEFVAIGPGLERILHTEAVDGDTLLLGIKLEDVADIVHRLHHIDLLHVEAQGVVLEFVEVHELVDELEHTLDATLCHTEQTLILATERRALHELAYRTRNHGKRCAELVGDVGKKTHVHLVGTQLLLLLHLCLTGGPTGCYHATCIAIEIVGEGRGQREVDEPSPPRISWGRGDHDAQGALVAIAFVAGIIGGANAEGIGARGQVGVTGSMGVGSIDPVAIETIHLIIVMYAFVFAEVEGCKRQTETVFAVLQSNFPTTVEYRLDGSVFRGAHQLVVNLQVDEADGQLQQRVHIGGVEHGDAIGAAEDQTAVGQLARGTIGKLIASDAIGLIERGDASRLPIPAVQTLHGADPEVALLVFLDAAYIRARESGDTRHLVGFEIVSQQTVAHGSYPHIALGILQHIRGDIHTTADALCHRGDIDLGEFPCLWIQAGDGLIEGRDEHLSVVEFQQRGNEAEVGIEGLFHDGL